MSLRIWFVTTDRPSDTQHKTFTGWDRAACHERIAAWEKEMGDRVIEWRLAYL